MVADTEKPSFNCPPEKTVFADEGQTTASVEWDQVVANDNSGHVNLAVSPDVTPPHVFVEGRHIVVYTATDPSGNTKLCDFRVNVEG